MKCTHRPLVFLVSLLLLPFLGGNPGHGQTPADLAELEGAFLKGMAFSREGKYEQALPFLERAAELAPAVFGPFHKNTSDILNTLGGAYSQASHPKKALTAFAESLKIREKILGPDHIAVSHSLENLANAHRSLGQFTEAEPLFLRALKITENTLGKDHIEAAITLNNLSILYNGMGRLKEAEPLILRSLSIREKHFGKDHPEIGNVLNTLGHLYCELGRYPEAEEVLTRGVRIIEEKFGKDHFRLEQPLNNLGMTYLALGRYRQAEVFLLRSLRLREERLPKDHPDLASIYNNLGNLCLDMGRIGEAETHFFRSLAIREARFGKEDLEVATTLNNLGIFYSALRRYKESEAHLLRCLEIRRKRLGPDHPALAGVLENLAVIYTAQKRHTDAERLFIQAIRINEAKLGKTHPSLGTCLQSLAVVYVDTNRLEEAEPLFLRSLKIGEAALGADHPNLGATYHNLGTLNTLLGRYEDAERYFLRNVAVEEKRGFETWMLIPTYQSLGDLSAMMGRPKEGMKLLEISLQKYQNALQQAFAFNSETTMHGFLEGGTGLLPSLLTIAVDPKVDAGPTFALDWTLRGKGVVFDAVCRFRQVQELLGPADPLTQKLADYRGLKQKLADATLHPPLGKDAKTLKMELERWSKEVLDLEAEINRGLAAKLPEARPSDSISAEAVRKQLAPEAALVELVRSPLRRYKNLTWSSPHYFAFVLVPGDAAPELIDLGEAGPIDKAVAALRQEFGDFQEKLKDCDSEEEVQDLEKKQEKQFLKMSQTLQALAFAPLRKALGKAKLVYLAPDGDLNRLPFEALVDEEGKYLIERFQFAYLSSGRDLLRPEVKSAKGTVVFANPDFRLAAVDREERAAKLLGEKKEGKVLVASRGPADSRSAGWKSLPGAAAEARDIQKLLNESAYGPVQGFQGPEALEEVLKTMKAPRVLHLATHGFFVDHEPDAAWKEGSGAGWARGRLKQMDNPLLRSGIVLAGANTVGDKDRSGKVEDGWVTAEEIALLNLRGTELVVLSACQTGLGDLKAGEGVSGLRWAFLYAGARTLVTSLFEVPDAETRDLMKQFYGRLKTQSKLDALQGARLALIEQRRASHGAAHPFFWASFVLVGDPR